MQDDVDPTFSDFRSPDGSSKQWPKMLLLPKKYPRSIRSLLSHHKYIVHHPKYRAEMSTYPVHFILINCMDSDT